MSIIPDIGTVDLGNSPGFESDGVITLATGETYLYGFYRRRPIDGPGQPYLLSVQSFDMTTLDLGQALTFEMFHPEVYTLIPEVAVYIARDMQNAKNGENV